MGNSVRSKGIFSQANIYTVVCLIYFLRHSLFGAFSLPGRAFTALFWALSLFFYFKTVLEYKLPSCLTALNFCLVLILFYGGFLALNGTNLMWGKGTGRFYYLMIHFESILPMYPFFLFAKKQQIDENWFRIAAIFFFIVAFAQFNRGQSIRLENTGLDETVNSEAYLLLSLFPIMVFFHNRPIIQYIGLFLIMFFLISGFKRGAILLGVVCLLTFLWQFMQSKELYKKVITVVLGGILLLFLIQYVEKLMINSDLFSRRIMLTMEGNSSGRDGIFSEYWSFFLNQNNMLTLLFGNGAFGTLKHLGLMAHNDWLEFLIDMGLFGTMVYLVYWICNIRMCVKSARICSHEVYVGILLFVIIYLGKSIFSMSIMSMSFYATSVFGYFVAQYDNCLNNKLS